jgi:thymidylate synthase
MNVLYAELNSAPISSPRGMPTKELINYSYTVRPGAELLVHTERKLNLAYVKRELLWYLTGRRYDTSIVAFAKIWESCIAKDGGINSNYGQYLMGGGHGLDRCVKLLKADRDSRRAVAMILGQHHAHWAGIDQPCTVSLQFLIRPDFYDRDELTTIVTMRSQDAIFGLGNDTPAFMLFAKLVAAALNIPVGNLHINVGSLHVYERHFKMLQRIALGIHGWGYLDRLPDISTDDALTLINGNVTDCELLRWIAS